MKRAHGLRRYFYEYIFHEAVNQAREQASETVPISQAKAIRARVDAILAQAGKGELADPQLGVSDCLSAIDQAFSETVRDYEPQFAEHSTRDKRYQDLQRAFTSMTGVGSLEQAPTRSAVLPISPYDPAWAERSSVKRAGIELTYLPDEAITRATGGEVETLADASHGDLVLRWLDREGQLQDLGPAMTHEDASGLTALMDKMSAREYESVRSWVIDGGRDPLTGQINPTMFMSQRAIARSAAVLEDLKSLGLSYEIARDREPGQIKARLSGTGIELRLTDTQQEEYAGARIYDNGTILRYSTNYRVAGGTAVHSPTPAQAVDLMRFALGQPLLRSDVDGVRVGTIGLTHPESTYGKTAREIADSYHVDRESMFVVDDYVAPGENKPRAGAKILLRRDAKNHTLPTFFTEAEPATTFVRAAVESARENLRSALAVDDLITNYELQMQALEGVENAEEALEPPAFSPDSEIAAIQRSYWDVLTGARSELLRPGLTTAMYQQRLDAIGELQADEVPDFGNIVYGGTPAQKVLAHADDVAFELIGTWEPEVHDIEGEWIEQRFDPGRVAKYMTSSSGQWTNLDNLSSALRRIGVPPSEIMGTDFQTTRFKDRLVRFNAETATAEGDVESPFLQRVLASVRETIEQNAAQVESIQLDDQGVIQWRGARMRRDGTLVPVQGEIGQVFDVGAYGEIVTKFASGQNALVVPGYEARIAAQQPGVRPTSVEERTRLRGYEQLIHERIAYQLAGDLVSGRTQVGEPSSLNAVYSQLYGTKHPVDFISRTAISVTHENGTVTLEPDEWTASILATEARRVRYSNEIKQGSTIYAEYRSERDQTDPANDNVFDAWRLTGGRNMAVLTGRDKNGVMAPGGYFDPVMTGGATNQGIVRYLTVDAKVLADGSIEAGDPETLTGSRAPLMTRPELETLRYDPFDRQQMTASTIMQSSEITRPTGTALMTFGGWTADDPIVISKEFAAEHQIRGTGGQLRTLVVGDKLSDLHGNKGVVSLIVDRDQDLLEAQEQGLQREVAFFKNNPELDVVMSPFSLISRRNAGSARELMTGEVQDVVVPGTAQDAKVLPGALGQMRFVVTHMAVDEKTKIYDDEAVLAGRGRKASSQLAWALQSQDCPAIMREFYGHNAGAEANLREYLLVTGLDMEADGTLRVVGQDEALDDVPERRLIGMPELIRTRAKNQDAVAVLNTMAMRRSFGELIGDRGGDLELPFPLTYPTGVQTESVSASSWKIPVMSSHLRSGQEFENGTTVTHDYTRSYQDVFVEACRYRYLAGQLEVGDLSSEKRAELRRGMRETAARAQRSFEVITGDVKSRMLSGKSNLFKNGLMASRLSDSATMVWTADPRLDIDQVALSSVKARQLGLTEGDHALIWRDPVLRDSGVRYMRVTIDDRLTGAAINPVMDKCFDGDFDGDAVAVVKLHTESAKREALEKLSVPANLLDTGVVGKDGTHPLAMHISLDTQVAISRIPELGEEFESSQREALLLHQEHTTTAGPSPERVKEITDELEYLDFDLAMSAGTDKVTEIQDRQERLQAELTSTALPDASDLIERSNDLVGELSTLYRQAQRGEFGTALTFSDRMAHLASIREVCVETGAKGSLSKLEDYSRNLGDDQGTPGITQADQEASMFATAIKSHGTGLGGSFSQRAVRALRGDDLKAVLEITYPVTQSILQAKHDAAEARHKYEMLQGPGRELWRGRLIEHTGPNQWRTVMEDGEAVQAPREEWQQQFLEFYTSREGFGVEVNPDYVERVAKALEDPKTGRIRNLEEEPALRGSLLDRMSYGGDFETLLEAARGRESIYDGEQSKQFAAVAARRAIRETERALAAMEPAVDGASRNEPHSSLPTREGAPLIAGKSDVLADNGRTRGSSRRSAHAVGVGPARKTYVPQFEDSAAEAASSTHEMEL